MIINSITLKNFKSYEDEIVINLRPSKDKSIVLIGGENGAGKSTLFEAIKICFYGPMAYGYSGQGYHYLDKVKSLINNNAYTNEKIESYVKIDLSLPNGNISNDYILTRTWSYIDQKIEESYSVSSQNQLLQDDTLDYFDHYLKSILPPSLFDFFFFDGENLNNLIDQNNNLKDSILQLLNINTFYLLKKQLNYYSKSVFKANDDLLSSQLEYEKASELWNQTKIQIDNTKNELENLFLEIDNLKIQREQLDVNFQKNGGILDEERNYLTSKISKIENEKTEINTYIRDFCNNDLPFLLLLPQLSDVKNQINIEKVLASYNFFRKKLTPELIINSISETINIDNLSEDNAYIIATNIIGNIFDTNKIQKKNELLFLSKEQANYILTICQRYLENNKQLILDLLSTYKKYNRLSLELKRVKDKLSTSISSDLLSQYLQDIDDINKLINSKNIEVQQQEIKLETLENQLENYKLNLTKAKNIHLLKLKQSNISDISENMLEFLDELITTLTMNKILSIQEEFIKIFHQIIRKDNFIDKIILNENFNYTLYQIKKYQKSDLINILNNVGYKNLETKYGSLFVQELLENFKLESIKDILQSLKQTTNDSFDLHTKISINSLSNGERQIFILCLIWSIIKVSKTDVPFIIDTPYARIDSTHRNALTHLYLPNISEQVIILSTNEEIDAALYQLIKPFISHEYLLVYDTINHKTLVKNNYFEV